MAKRKKHQCTCDHSVGLDDIVFILDRSGSMGSIWPSVVEGTRSFLKEQQSVAREAEFAFWAFNDTPQRYYSGDIEVATLDNLSPYVNPPGYETRSKIFPRGNTALCDAIGMAVEDLKRKLARSPIQPENIIVAVYTDGLENASHRYSREQIKNLIRDCEFLGWKFLFLGAGIDAFAAADDLGFSRSYTKSTPHTAHHAGGTISAMGAYTSSLRSGASVDEASRDFDKCYMAIVGEAPTQTAANSGGSSSTPQNNKGWKNKRDSKGRFTSK